MDFATTERATELRDRLRGFMAEHVLPVEAEVAAAIDAEVAPGVPFPAVLLELRERARAAGLWNLFMPDERYGPALSHGDYGVVAEETGRVEWAPMVFNGQAPDSGNMEILAEHATPEQVSRYLEPMLAGELRSCFAMTEPDVAGSDPTGLECRAQPDGDGWVIDGRKWFATGALGAQLAIVMAVTDPDARPHARASMVLVPMDADGLQMVRPISHMGHSAGPGHWEIAFHGCRVGPGSLLGGRGEGFRVAQHRLGPGRIHHCFRLLGVAERALEMMCARASGRVLSGEPLARKQFVQDFVARSRIEIDACRLLTCRAAWEMDTIGKRDARHAISIAKVATTQMVMDVTDRAIQVHGALGVSDDIPLAAMWRGNRYLRIGDGADEVHKHTIARHELARFTSPATPEEGAA